MKNYLNILPIIFALFISSCSNSSQNNSNINENPIDLATSSSNANHLYNSMYINFALDRSLYDDALLMFTKNINNIDDTKLFYRLTKIALLSYKYDQADLIATKWLKLQPSTYLPYQFSIITYLENNQLDKAQITFQNYLKNIKPKSKNDFSKLMNALSENKNRLNVMKFFDNYLLSNNNRELHLSYIELLYIFNMPLKVIAAIEELGTFNERNLIRLYSSSHMILKEYDKAGNILKTYLNTIKNTDRQIQLELLEAYVKNSDLEDAKYLIDEILLNDSDNPDTIYQIGRLLSDGEQYDLSEKYLLSIVIEDDRVNFLRGINDYRMGFYNEAIEHFQRVNDYSIKIMSELNIGMSMTKTQNTEAGIEYFLNKLNDYEDPDVRVQFFLKIISLLNQEKRYKDIINFVDEESRNKSLGLNLIYSRAMAFEALGNIDMMERDLKSILELDSKNANTLNALGYSLTIHTNRYNEAFRMIELAYQFDPGNAAILDSLAWIYFKKNKYIEALKHIEASYMRDQDIEIVEHYCEILIKNKMYERLRYIINIESKKHYQNKEFMKKIQSYKNAIPL
tara:strand:- start:145 stop:1848 length:1704 start_codon:yes stop_codon:yes gene_type:complete